MPIHAALHHVTHYQYDRLVGLGPQTIRLRPAPHCRSNVISYSLKVEPTQHFINWQQDPFANYQARLVFPEKTREFAINASNSRFWEPAVKRYVDECLAGSTGPRGVDFNMRWIASLVAETHRILMRGGVFMYPRDNKDPTRNGRLRLLYEANPISMLIEQAGGRATTGRTRILEVKPDSLHQRIGFIFGSAEEVSRIEGYHADEPLDSYKSPLFGRRGLFATTS